MFSLKGNTSKKSAAGDRFIPRRLDTNFSLSSSNSTSSLEDLNRVDADYYNSAKTRFHHENYKRALQDALGLGVSRRALHFTSPKKQQRDAQCHQSVKLPDWPVSVRKRPVIGAPQIVLDMPQFDSSIDHNVADWSKKNCLGAIFEGEVHMWYAFNSSATRDLSNTGKMVQNCVKFNEDGTQVAFGFALRKIGVWDIVGRKMSTDVFCCAMWCKVNTLQWISSTTLLSGCSNGVLNLIDVGQHACKIRSRQLDAAIVNIVTSCRKKFAATCCMDRRVSVWTLPELSAHIVINFSTVVKAVSFHPWQESLLATGGAGKERVRLWNVNAHKQMAAETNVYSDCNIDALSFNPTSAELVVAYFVKSEDVAVREGRSATGTGIVSVLGDMERVVEELHVTEAPIPYLLWGNEGSVLAAISADENLFIWDFFDEKMKKSRQKNAKKTASSLIRTV